MPPHYDEKSFHVDLHGLKPPPLAYIPRAFDDSRAELASIESSAYDYSPKPKHQELSIVPNTNECTTKACLCVFGAFLSLFCTFGQLNSNGTFQTWYSNNQLSTLPQSTINWICSIQVWVFFFVGWPVGILFDRFGPQVLLIVGTVLHLMSIVAMSFSTQYWHFLLSQGILFGLGVGLVFYPSMSATATHFNKYRASALGIAASGSGVGGIVYPIFLRQLLPKLGFSWTVRLSGIFSIVFCIVAIFTITNHPSKVPHRQQLSFGHVFAGISKDRPFILLSAACIVVASGLYIPFFYLATYARSIGVSSTLSFYTISVLNAGSVVGRITPALLADKLGRFNMLAPSILIGGLSCLFLWMFAHSTAVIMVFAVVYGFASGAFISLIVPCVAQISKIEHIGTRVGAVYTLTSFPSLVGGPFAGWLLTRAVPHGSFTGMIAFSGSTLVCGALLVLGTKLSIDTRFSRIV